MTFGTTLVNIEALCNLLGGGRFKFVYVALWMYSIKKIRFLQLLRTAQLVHLHRAYHPLRQSLFTVTCSTLENFASAEKHRKCGPTLYLLISSRFPLTHSSPERRLSHFVTYVFIYFPVANVRENSRPSRYTNPSLIRRRSFQFYIGFLGLI